MKREEIEKINMERLYMLGGALLRYFNGMEITDEEAYIISNCQDNENVTFRTLDSNIATVSNTGIVTAQGTGTTYIELKDEQKEIIAKIKIIILQNLLLK